MTNLHDGQITDLLSNSMRHNPETIAMGYAILQEKRRIIEYVDRTRLMAFVETLDERILDYLAVELRTPAYKDTFPVDVKRRLIAGTLPFYATLGTPAAVDWIIQAIFGSGRIEEWFEYGGEPHHFRVSVRNNETFNSLNGLANFLRLVASIKRLSSWLDEITVTTDMVERILYFGGAFGAQTALPIPESPDGMKWLDTLRAGGGMALVSVLPVPERA